MINIYLYSKKQLISNPLLPNNIIAHCAIYKNKELQLISKNNYYYLENILTKQYNNTISNIYFTNFGKPIINDKLFLSLSHTSSYFGFAINDISSIGFDIENINRVKSKFSHYILNEDEKVQYYKAQNKNLYLAIKWCEKEALGKLNGSGINKSILKLTAPYKFTYQIDNNTILVLVSNHKMGSINLYLNNELINI